MVSASFNTKNLSKTTVRGIGYPHKQESSQTHIQTSCLQREIGVPYPKEINYNNAIILTNEVKYKDGAVYIGDTNKNYEKNGYGITNRSHSILSGGEGSIEITKYKADLIAGPVIRTWSITSIIMEDFEENQSYGFGIFIEFSGNKCNLYQGERRDDQKEGRGIFSSQNGDIFLGHWENDEKSGFGILKNKTGKIISQGIWKGDVLIQEEIVPFKEIQEIEKFISENSNKMQTEIKELLEKTKPLLYTLPDHTQYLIKDLENIFKHNMKYEPQKKNIKNCIIL